MTIFFYKGFALHVRLNAPGKKLVNVHPGWDTDRQYLVLAAADLDEAMQWVDRLGKRQRKVWRVQ